MAINESYNGMYIGVVAQTGENGMAKIFIPSISNTLYKNWNDGDEDIEFKTLTGKYFSNDVMERMKATLPWARPAQPLWGGGTGAPVNSDTTTPAPLPSESTISDPATIPPESLPPPEPRLTQQKDQLNNSEGEIDASDKSISLADPSTIDKNNFDMVNQYAKQAANLDNDAVSNGKKLFSANSDGIEGNGSFRITSYSGGSDKNLDTNSTAGLGNNDNILTSRSIAIAPDVKSAIEQQTGQSMKLGQSVYVNGNYLGNYDDTSGTAGTIDLYDPHGQLGESFNKNFDLNNAQFNLGGIQPQLIVDGNAWKKSSQAVDYASSMGVSDGNNVVRTTAMLQQATGSINGPRVGGPIGSFSPPMMGAKVWVFFHEGNPQNPVYFANVHEYDNLNALA
jgi:hypothetical protein